MIQGVYNLQIFIFASVITTSLASFCGKLGAFDALCTYGDAVFFVSVSPCHEMEDPFSVSPVGLTIINTSQSLKKYDITTSKDISKPLSFGRTDVGVMIEMHYHSAGPMRGHLHIDLSLGNLTDNGVNSRKSLLNLYFYTQKFGLCINSFSGSSFYPSPACQESKRTGNYSTLCISKPSSSVDKSSQGIFFISVDPCTMPISYWAVALFPNKNNTQVIRQFTASKIDSFVPVESANCGFKVEVVPEFSESHVLAMTMLYGCTDSSAVQLINDYYFPELGEMCMPSKCEVLSTNRRRCFSNMLVGHQKTVNMTTDITVVECGRPHKVEIVMRMGSLQDELHAEFDNNRLYSDFFFGGINKTTAVARDVPPIVNGYIPRFGGYLSVNIERYYDLDLGITHHHRHTEDRHLMYIFIDRNYGNRGSKQLYVNPIIFEEISLSFCKDSLLPRPPGGHSTLSAAMSALVAISVIAVVAVLIGFVVYRKMRRNKHADGLPYQIELNYDEETDPSYRDDL